MRFYRQLSRLVSAVVTFSAFCFTQSAYSTETSYVLVIDWARNADQVTLMTFDDQGDSTPRQIVWGGLQGGENLPRPDSVSFEGLVGATIFPVTATLTFDGESVLSLTSCDNFFSGCDGTQFSFGGFRQASFSLGARGSANRADFFQPPGVNCGGLFQPRECMVFDIGTTSFIALTPSVPAIPEPSTFALLALGLLGVFAATRRRVPSLQELRFA